MKYVYAIICHKCTNPLVFTVKKLLKSEKSIVIVHIDSKADHKEVEKIYTSLGVHENLHIIPRNQRIEVHWGHFSQVEVMLLLMNKAVEFNFQYFSLISGDDISILSNEKRELFFLDCYKDQKEFIGFMSKHNAKERLSINYSKIFFSKSNSLYSRILKKIYLNYLKIFSRKSLSHLPELYKGSQWFTLSDYSIRYILNYIENNPSYIESFKNSFCADEVFFQTIILNNLELRKNIFGINDNLNDCIMSKRYIDWVTGPDFPRTLDESDVNKVKDSNLLFARKFKNDIPFEILDKYFKN